ncbi:hypothetical protein C2S53_000521 [Perilla frutescens var. hirtella]|uniref:Uncharacterized protein n=1 Tax=Perilla frutescens var. hirtella TaxID=608512 RepID=A0AAD4PDJ2_PERFH|nr:hypothetical protein C2S53_000521 [Perilla frutescens var. hirtella]
MEIPAWLFFSFWALTSITFLHLAINALDQTHLSKSVSPLVIFSLKHSLAISSCCSSNYALRYRPHEEVRSHYLLMLYVILCAVFSTITDGIMLRRILTNFFARLLYLMIPVLPALLFLSKIISKILLCFKILQYALLLYSLAGAIFPIIVKFVSTVFSVQFLCYLPIFLIVLLWHLSIEFLRFSWIFCVLLLDVILSCGTGDSYSKPETKARIAVLMISEISLFFVSVENTKFSPILVLFVSHSISANLVALGERVVATSKMRKVIEFGVGIAGAIVFHNLFKSTSSFKEVEAFFYLAVMWLANLTLLGFPFDFAIFDFLVCNMVVAGCVVSELGLTLLAYAAAALLLFGLRLKLESLTLEYEEGDQIQIQ